MNPSQQALLDQLRLVVDVAKDNRPDFAYRCVEDFMLRHGVFHEVATFPKGLKTGAPKMCFGNAIAMSALKGWRYIEGFALTDFGLATAHGWNLDSSGRLIDVTWRNQGLAYLGVEFALGRAFEAGWDGDACVIDDWKRHWPLFQQEWKGEDFGRWPFEEARRRVFETFLQAATSGSAS